MTTAQRWLLVDHSSVLMRSIFALPPTLSAVGCSTSGLFGFVRQLAQDIVTWRPTHILICHDTHPYIRKRMYPEYKAKRKKQTDPAIVKAIVDGRLLTSTFFEMAGIQRWAVPGYEADDLVAHAARAGNDAGARQIVIQSNDSDLFQIFALTPDADVRIRKAKHWYTREDFDAEFGISPAKWRWVIAIGGSHNGVPGIPGFALKRALAVVKDEVKLEQMKKQHPEIKLHARLARLPLNKGEGLEMPEMRPLKINRRGAEKFLAKYQIRIDGTMNEAFDLLS